MIDRHSRERGPTGGNRENRGSGTAQLGVLGFLLWIQSPKIDAARTASMIRLDGLPR